MGKAGLLPFVMLAVASALVFAWASVVLLSRADKTGSLSAKVLLRVFAVACGLIAFGIGSCSAMVLIA